MDSREKKSRRLDQLNLLQSMPFGSLAFNSEMTCAICIDDFKDDDTVRQLRCHVKHVFHKDCIDRWLQEDGHCPICKRTVLDG